jgi:hypothetical protein
MLQKRILVISTYAFGDYFAKWRLEEAENMYSLSDNNIKKLLRSWNIHFPQNDAATKN